MSQNTFFRDRKGQLLGRMQQNGDSLYMFNHRGELLGWYHESQNVTFNRRGERFGTGNQVARLLKS